MTRDVLPPGLSAAEIDREVKERTQRGEAIYALDEEAVRALEPDLIVTQELCPVCAVSYDEVAGLAKKLPTCPKVVALDPKTFGETLGDARTIAAADRRAHRRHRARQGARAARVDAVRRTLRDAGAPPIRVAALEWFDPVFIAGHWTPQLIEYAGGLDVLGLPGEHSRRSCGRTWPRPSPRSSSRCPAASTPQTAYREAELHADALRATGARRVVAVDGGAYFSRPGPRLVEGLELLAHVLHPDLFPHAPGEVIEVPLP